MTAARNLNRWSGYLFALPYLALFSLFIILPLVYGLVLSFFKWELLSQVPPQFIGVENYRKASQDSYFWQALMATAKFVVLSAPITILCALAIALGLNSVKNRRQTVYRAAFFIPGMITISVAGVLWRWFFNNEFGLFNALLAPFSIQVPWISDVKLAMPSIVLMTLWWTVGGPTVVLLAGIQQIPPQYHEAASLDGANSWQKFLFVTLPLLRPVLLFVGVLNVIGAFQVFGQVFMITRGGPENTTRTLVQYIYETAFNNYHMGYAAALSWILFLVIAIFSFIQFRLTRER